MDLSPPKLSFSACSLANLQQIPQIHLGFNPDEEIGGHDGLAKFVHSNLFNSLNVGFGMDEGLASETEVS